MREKKYLIEEATDATMNETQREARINSLSLRTDNELFNEDLYKPQPIINIKFHPSNRNGDAWEILKDKKIVLKIPADKLSKNEKSFMSSNEGMVWFLQQAKKGVDSVAAFKRALTLKIKK